MNQFNFRKKFSFLESLSRSLGEQVMNDDRKRQALKDYIISLVQRKFDQYIDQTGRDAIMQQEDAGIDRVYIKAFGPLTIDSSIRDLNNEFPDITEQQIIEVIDELNDETSSKTPERNEKGELKGFWVDLVNVAKELYDGEHMKVDVFVDQANGDITFGIDDPEEVFQIALD